MVGASCQLVLWLVGSSLLLPLSPYRQLEFLVHGAPKPKSEEGG